MNEIAHAGKHCIFGIANNYRTTERDSINKLCKHKFSFHVEIILQGFALNLSFIIFAKGRGIIIQARWTEFCFSKTTRIIARWSNPINSFINVITNVITIYKFCSRIYPGINSPDEERFQNFSTSLRVIPSRWLSWQKA